jgi:hypothetical protein
MKKFNILLVLFFICPVLTKASEKSATLADIPAATEETALVTRPVSSSASTPTATEEEKPAPSKKKKKKKRGMVEISFQSVTKAIKRLTDFSIALSFTVYEKPTYSLRQGAQKILYPDGRSHQISIFLTHRGSITEGSIYPLRPKICPTAPFSLGTAQILSVEKLTISGSRENQYGEELTTELVNYTFDASKKAFPLSVAHKGLRGLEGNASFYIEVLGRDGGLFNVNIGLKNGEGDILYLTKLPPIATLQTLDPKDPLNGSSVRRVLLDKLRRDCADLRAGRIPFPSKIAIHVTKTGEQVFLGDEKKLDGGTKAEENPLEKKVPSKKGKKGKKNKGKKKQKEALPAPKGGDGSGSGSATATAD